MVYFGGRNSEPHSGSTCRGFRRRSAPFQERKIPAENPTPRPLRRETLRIMRRAGVNRISVGVQSLQDNELEKLGQAPQRKAGGGTYCPGAAGGIRQHFRWRNARGARADGGFPDGHAGAAREAPDTAHFGVHADAGTSYAVRKIAACGIWRVDQTMADLSASRCASVLPAGSAASINTSISDFARQGIRAPTDPEILGVTRSISG